MATSVLVEFSEWLAFQNLGVNYFPDNNDTGGLRVEVMRKRGEEKEYKRNQKTEVSWKFNSKS